MEVSKGEELLRSLSEEERAGIEEIVASHEDAIDTDLVEKLDNAQLGLKQVLDEIERVEWEMLENDIWFDDVVNNRFSVAAGEEFNRQHKRHREKAGDLYFERKGLTEKELPAARDRLAKVEQWVETEEQEKVQLRQHIYSQELEKIFHDRQAIQKIEDIKKAVKLREDRERKEKEDEHNRRISENRSKVAEEVNRRRIDHLLHFTPLVNLPSILEQGLVARNQITGKYLSTDSLRADGWLDWVSVSIGFPNYKMFFIKRREMAGVCKEWEWAVLLLEPSILSDCECMYFAANAASNSMRYTMASRLGSYESFECMFGEDEKRQGIPDGYTTDPQAEVMVRNMVDRQHIKGIHVLNDIACERVKNLTSIPALVEEKYFLNRMDYEGWKATMAQPNPGSG